MLLAVELHGGIGVYRLALKWGWVTNKNGQTDRVKLRRIKWGITGFFLVLGLLTLSAYMKLGYEHREHVGERYTKDHHQTLNIQSPDQNRQDG